MMAYIKENHIACPNCGNHDFTDIRQFNLMFKTFQGVVEDAKNAIYLRPETAQGMFVNFKNVQRTMRKKLPFGIGQIGNLSVMRLHRGILFSVLVNLNRWSLNSCQPGTDLEWYEHYKAKCMKFLTDLGVKEENLRFRDHSAEELAFYSKGTCDIEYNFESQIGWGEIWGIADRTDYDLGRHQEHSKKSLEYQDPQTNEKYLAYCIERSVRVERLMLAFMCDAYDEEVVGENDTRIVLHLHPALAPYKAVLCL